MSLTNDLANMLKDIFFTDLFATKKKYDNLVGKFNNTKKNTIDFINERITKNSNRIMRSN